jgi:NAD-dependent deacetylase
MEAQKLDILAGNVADLIIAAKRVVVFTGAGISTESGVPDFRSPGGLWSRFDPDDFTYQKFVSRPETRKVWWQLFRERGLSEEIKPNLAHEAISELNRLGKLDCLITQNIDNLHQKAGLPDEKIFELHGNFQWARCLNCGRRYSFEQVQQKLEGGEEIPSCEVCGGVLKPGIVFFGESLPEGIFIEASHRAENADLMIVIGSTLIVYPAAEIPFRALARGAKLVIINLSPTPLDDRADVLIQAKAGEAMSRIIERLKDKIKSGSG